MSDSNHRPVIIWLATGCFLVTLMVVIGGLTRLTHSGLSMVEWKLVMGALPPLSEEAWQVTFDKYKQFPEYQKININFTLEDFKSIFWWEYLHRLLGRIIGLVFIIPFTIFYFQKRFTKKLTIQLLIMLTLGAFQGFLGWFMVKSGLVNDPNVSHYRLAAHLIAALGLCSYIFWVMLDLLYEHRSNITTPPLRSLTKGILILTTIQITYGAFVAGLKAGYFYPTFPKMGNHWMPIEINNSFSTSGWISLLDNVTTVQFIHRWLGIVIFIGTLFIWIVFSQSVEYFMQKRLKGLLGLVCIQVILGIWTLLYGVPIISAVTHQFVALLFLLQTVFVLHGTSTKEVVS